MVAENAYGFYFLPFGGVVFNMKRLFFVDLIHEEDYFSALLGIFSVVFFWFSLGILLYITTFFLYSYIHDFNNSIER